MGVVRAQFAAVGQCDEHVPVGCERHVINVERKGAVVAREVPGAVQGGEEATFGVYRRVAAVSLSREKESRVYFVR